MKIERLKILFRIPLTTYFVGRYYLEHLRLYGIFEKKFNGNYYWEKI